jgi:AcrR family transcriptional regulator
MRLIHAAVKLVYKHGFAHTSLADIARDAQVPLGNVYYYFKAKEEIAEAIIDQYMERFHALREHLSGLDSPRERLCAFVQMTLDDRNGLVESGCPVGTLCSELCKETGALAGKSAQLFAVSLMWMEEQFEALGESDARGLATHLLSALEGISVLAQTLKDPHLVTAEAARLKTWVQNL